MRHWTEKMLRINRYVPLRFIGLNIVVLGLLACGGGASENFNERDESLYIPDENLLDEPAMASSELYVDQDFSFGMQSLLLLRVSASGVDGSPVASTTIHIYALKEKFTSWQEIGQSDRELLAIGSTDELGSFQQSLEVSPLVEQLLITVNAIGIENKALLAVDKILSHHFTL